MPVLKNKRFFFILLFFLFHSPVLHALEGKLNRQLWKKWDDSISQRQQEAPAWRRPQLDIIKETPAAYFDDGQKKLNPHRQFDCLICHEERPEVETADAASITLNSPGNEILLVCGKCHQRGGYHFLHSEPKKLQSLPNPNLPLPQVGHSKGLVICTTCHDVHMPASSYYLLRSYGPNEVYQDRRQFCGSCHKYWEDKSFHVLNQETDITLCFSCHANNPFVNMGDALEFTFDLTLNCNFCHDSLTDKHYLEVLTEQKRNVIKSPSSANIVLFNGTFTCVSCHLPHVETLKTPVLLRKNYFSRISRSTSLTPHRRLIFCTVCHEKMPQAGEKLPAMTAEEINQLCFRCHWKQSEKYPQHPVGMRPRNTKFIKYDRRFRLTGRRLTCLTCHDLTGHDKRTTTNAFFLQDGPYEKPRELCDKCHVRKLYTRINPHFQLTFRGELIGETCTLCHEAYDKKGKLLKKDCSLCHLKRLHTSQLRENHLRLKASPDFLCLLCHEKKSRKHEVEHLRKRLDEKMLEQLGHSMAKEGAAFPLGNQARILCVTCHYQHQVGVLIGEHEPIRYHLYRLRTGSEKLCTTCHD